MFTGKLNKHQNTQTKKHTHTQKNSYGVCLWEFFTRRDPYEGMPVFQIIFAVGSEGKKETNSKTQTQTTTTTNTNINKIGLRPTVPDNCPPEYSSLMQECKKSNKNE